MKLKLVVVLATILTPLWAQDLPIYKVTQKAQKEVKAEDEKARVAEAKGLLRELESLQARMAEISKRLKDLDEGASAKKEPVTGGCTISNWIIPGNVAVR